MEERTKTHLLKIKSEKLGEMIQQHARHGTWGGANTSHNTGYPGSGGNPPYPMHGNPAMPQLHLPPVSN